MDIMLAKLKAPFVYRNNEYFSTVLAYVNMENSVLVAYSHRKRPEGIQTTIVKVK